MLRSRWDAYRTRVRAELKPVFDGNSSPHVIASSFALGVFITALPTLGTGLIVLALIATFSRTVNTLALFAAVVVLNPLAKSGVYVASYSLGTTLMGPVPGAEFTDISLSAGAGIVSRLVLGNTIIAIAFAGLGYVLVKRGVRLYRTRGVDIDGAVEIAD